MTVGKKIAVFHPTLNPVGGGETVSIHLIKTLSKLGYGVTLVTIEKTNWSKISKVLDLTAPNINENYTFQKLPNLVFPAVTSILLLILYLLKLIWYKIVKREYCLLINTCGEKINSISDLVYFNAIPLRCAFKISSTTKFRKWMSRLYNLMLTFIDWINPNNILLANSEFNKNLIFDTIGRNSKVIYPPIDFDRIKPSLLEKTESVVIVTRFLPEQNLEIIPELVAKTPGIEYTLIGPTSDQSEPVLKNIGSLIEKHGVSDRVNLFFNKSFGFYTTRLEEAKIMLRPLPSEPFGISILEAMYLGCIPVVHRSSGPWMDILDQKQGLYGYSFNDLEELSVIIKQLLRDEVLLDGMRQRVQTRALEFQERVFSVEISQVVTKLMKE